MLNFSDVQKLRGQGQTNRQILEMMAPVVPSAAKVLRDIDGDKVTPAWQMETKIGKMLDSHVPKNAPSGLGYMTAVSLNQAQKKFDEKTQHIEAQNQALEQDSLFGRLQQRNQAAFGTDSGLYGAITGEQIQPSALQRFMTGEQGVLETGLQVAGQGAGAVNDVIGAGLGLAGKGLSAITPDAIEKPVVNAVSGAFQAGAEAVGLPEMAQKYDAWRQTNPRAAADLEGVVNIASLLPLPKLSQVGRKGMQAATQAVGVDDLGKKAAVALRNSSDDSIGRGLNPTTKVMKEKTQKLAPELAKRPLSETFAPTRKGMLAKAQESAEIAGEQIDNLGPLQGTTKANELLDYMESQKGQFMSGGKVVNAKGVEAVDKVKEIIVQYGDDIPDENLREIRRIFDTETKAAKKTFGITPGEASEAEMKKVAANKIRGILAEKHPDLAKLNKEYTFWSNLEEVLGATTSRKTGQKGLLKNVATIAGAASGEGLADSVGRGIVFRTVAAVAESPAWGVLSAKLKNRIADALINKDLSELGKVLGLLPGQTAVQVDAE